MTNQKNQFQQGYTEGRNETREILDGKEMSSDYSFKLARPIVYLSVTIGIVSFFYFWIFEEINFLLSVLFAFITFSGSMFILGMSIGLLILAIRKTQAKK